MFKHNTTGVNESGDFSPIPEGTYTFRIKKTEIRESSKGDKQVNITLVVSEGKYEGRKVFYLITFLPPDSDGAGIAKRWLHAIGEEYEGEITVNPSQWSGPVKADVKIEEYKKRDGSIGRSNKIIAVHLPENLENENVGFRSLPKDVQKAIASEASSIMKNQNDDVPF